MTKLVTFLGRKTVSAIEKPAAAPQPLTATAAAEKSDIELDQDLFFPAATQSAKRCAHTRKQRAKSSACRTC